VPGHKTAPLNQAAEAPPSLDAQVEALGAQPDAACAWEAMLTAPPAASAQLGAPGASPPAPGEAAAAGTPAAAAAAAAAAASSRNQNRVTNIVWFFAVYAGFKYLMDNDLWA